jgi:hypothetical protein
MAKIVIRNQPVVISGKLLKVARIPHEPYDCLDRPEEFVREVKAGRIGADIFSFLQDMSNPNPKYDFPFERHRLAVVPITTYADWEQRIGAKTRNMVRKAKKAGVDIRMAEFGDEFVRGVVEIYNETPVRQGSPFKHYRKPFETIKNDLATFFDRSIFVGAYAGKEMIGFTKIVKGTNGRTASLMHILSKIAARDRAPTNALIAKAIEICAERGIGHLHYGVWSRRGLGEFKKNHAFECFDIPRYYVALTAKGRLSLGLKLHRSLKERLPENWVDNIVTLRAKWNQLRQKHSA